MTHTPGPWTVGDLDANGQRIVRQQHIEICTCWHHSVGAIELEMEFNARLIAAAPDMLTALRSIAEGNLGDDPWQANYAKIKEVAQNAFSKAVGDIEPDDASTRFGKALSALPALAQAAGCYVGVKVTEAKS